MTFILLVIAISFGFLSYAEGPIAGEPLLAPSCSLQEKSAVTVELHANVGDHGHILDHAITHSFVLDAITFQSDVYMSKGEFDYLVDLPQGSTVSVAQIKKAVSYLFKKNKFEKIIVTLTPGAQGYAITMQLVGFWTFKKLKFDGMMIGKENYRHYYTMESGDPFDKSKHELCLSKIRDAFKSEGYFNALVDSHCSYDNDTKQVVVHCALHRKEKFNIDSACIEIKGDASMTTVEHDDLVVYIQKNFIKRVNRGSYSKDYLNKETQNLKMALSKKGFIYVTINLREQVNYTTKKIDLVFSLDVHHKKEFVFFGNSFFTTDHLLDSILEFGHSAWLLPASLFAQEIEQAYQKKGFWSVVVQANEEPERYRFAITEGERVSVRKVVLKYDSDAHVPPQALDCFAAFTTSKFYDADIFKQSLDALIAWYLHEGFWDAKVLKHDFVRMSGDKVGNNDYQLILTIDEGPRSYLTSVSLGCFKELEHQGPFVMAQKKDLRIPFDAKLLHEQRRWLIEYFRAQGYLHVDIKPDIVRDKGDVAITWKINRGQSQSKFGKTVIVGSRKFPFESIVRQLTYKDGQIWDQDALKQSFLNLKKLDVFEHIHFSPDQITKVEDEKAVILKLQEDDPYEVRVRGGLELKNVTQQLSTDGLTYRLGGAFILKNPANLGDQFIFDADIAFGYREVSAAYRLPWLFDQPIKTEFQVFSNKYLQPGFVGNTQNIYEMITHGALVNFSRTLNYVDVGLSTGFEWMETSIPDRSPGMSLFVDSIAKAIDFNRRLLDQQVPFFRIEPTAMIDLLDQKINPTKGSFTVLSVKGLFPLNKWDVNTYMVKALLEQSLFVSFKSIVLAFRFRCGHIFQNNFSSIMPSERFYLGGANSIRSYDTDFAPPLGRFSNDQGLFQFAPQGGKSMINVNAEARFPIYKRLGGVIFQDLGALSTNRFATFKPQDILAGTGIGARLDTPVGPLRFDFAWKWAKPDPTCRGFAWFLTFGQAF